MLKILAPAKINLSLELLGKRPDGYHEINTIIQAVKLFDILELDRAPDIRLEADITGLSVEANLVFKAALMLKESSNYPGGAIIKLTKHIPEAGGLGGGSSDAAATLIGLNALWRLGLVIEDLLPLAAKLGSDVPFFLYGGAALAKGRGEWITPIEQGLTAWVILLDPALPPLPDKTRRLYSILSRSSFTGGEFSAQVADCLNKGHIPEAAQLFNVFESVAFDVFQKLNDYKERFLAAGANWVHLAGSGPTLYTMVTDQQEAEKLQQSLTSNGLKAYVAQTLDRRII